jgi:putative ABC transport system substrate-binding protein
MDYAETRTVRSSRARANTEDIVRRRELIKLLGGALASPLGAARAQERIRRVGVLLFSAENDTEYQSRFRVFRQDLQKMGWTEGLNVSIDVHWAGGNSQGVQEIASEFASRAPDVVLCSGSVATAAMKRATSSIPVVFTLVNEPVTQGFVASLARPGGNITGFTNIDFSVVGKMVELLNTMVPALKRIGLMFNSDTYPIYETYLRDLQVEQREPLEVVRATVRSRGDIDPVIHTLAALPGSGLVVLADGGFTVSNRALIQAAVDRDHVPSITPFRKFVSEGALMSYGPDDLDVYRRAAEYVDRILKGANPAELPVQQPVKFELVINLKTAKTLGVTVPLSLQAAADEVIE